MHIGLWVLLGKDVRNARRMLKGSLNVVEILHFEFTVSIVI